MGVADHLRRRHRRRGADRDGRDELHQLRVTSTHQLPYFPAVRTVPRSWTSPSGQAFGWRRCIVFKQFENSVKNTILYRIVFCFN